MIPLPVAIGIVIIPLIALFLGLALGFLSTNVSKLALVGVGLLIGSALWLGSLIFADAIAAIPFFGDLVNLVRLFPLGTVVFGSALLTTVMFLIAILELGYFTGYASGAAVHKNLVLSTSLAQAGQNTVAGVPGGPMHSVQRPGSFSPISQLSKVIRPHSLGVNLSEDERTLASLFVFNKLNEITPKLDDTSPEGYYYEQLKALDWQVSRQTISLNALAHRGFLLTSPKEQIIHCSQCGSSSLQFSSECPGCGSLQLSKHRILEHFSCGMIDKEEKFRTPAGDMICPKCNKRLGQIGADYRSLGMMYVCQNCGSLNKDLSNSLKCRKCGFSGPPSEQKEENLFAYQLSESMLPRLYQYLKPIAVIAKYFTSLDYSVFAPASIKGKSGMEQTVNLLVVGRGRTVTDARKELISDRFIIEIIASD
ncbi:MAG: hypothetical protein ACRDF4_11000, partial [Rhabdochlamydiaceae bacterium]